MNPADHQFFEAEITRLLDDLYAAAMRLAKNRQDAEDLVAEAVTKAWTSLGTLREPKRFRPWVFAILTNTFISDCRKSKGERGSIHLDETSSDAGAGFSIFEKLHQPFLLWWSNPEKEFLNKLLREDIEKAVDALPEAFRIVVILSEMEGFSYQEIAEMLSVPVGTVRSRLSRGRGLLQERLWKHAEEAGLIGGRGPAEGKTRALLKRPAAPSKFQTQKGAK